eukprot:jgi/Mesvir1/5591/Mv15610-RA.1
MESPNDCGLSLFESLPRELIQKIFDRSYPDGYALSKTLQPHFDVVKAKKVEAAEEEKLWAQWEELEYGIRNIMGLRVFRRTRQRIEERLYDVLSKNLPFGERISCFANKVYNQIARQEQMAGRKTEGPGWDYGFGWWRAAADAHWANFRNTEVLKP